MKKLLLLITVVCFSIQCKKEDATCVCTNKIKFKMGDLFSTVKGKDVQNFNTGESNQIKFSIIQNGLCPSQGIEIKVLQSTKVLFKKTYKEGLISENISVPDHTDITFESSLVDLKNELSCVWLGNSSCIVEY
ncbi:MAG: hypothetical protein HOP11_00740 [Saprospiraceae bacterium]|nr:hypothetical protein [Saprospiraceae bacterium]